MFLNLVLLERDVVSSVLNFPGAHHPALSHLSSGWRGAVSSGEAHPGALLCPFLPKRSFCAVTLNPSWLKPSQVSHTNVHIQQLRKLVLEIIHRIPTNEHLRPHVKNILSVMFRFLEVSMTSLWDTVAAFIRSSIYCVSTPVVSRAFWMLLFYVL